MCHFREEWENVWLLVKLFFMFKSFTSFIEDIYIFFNEISSLVLWIICQNISKRMWKTVLFCLWDALILTDTINICLGQFIYLKAMLIQKCMHILSICMVNFHKNEGIQVISIRLKKERKKQVITNIPEAPLVLWRKRRGLTRGHRRVLWRR